MNTLQKLLGLALLRITAALPQSVERAIARASAWLMWRANGRLRIVTECNLAISFPSMPEGERVRLARLSLYEFSLCVLELGRTWLWPFERLEARATRVVGLNLLQEIAASGTGTILLMPHLGNWELAYLLLSKDYSLTTLYKPPKTTVFGDVIHNFRTRRGIKMAPANSSGVRTLLKALKSGQMVSVLPDQVPPISSGMFAPFFGEMALTMTLVTSLIQRTKAKAICCYCKRLPHGQYELVLSAVDDRIYDPDCGTALAGLNASIESCVMDCIEQYQWEYKRYKFLPNMEMREYRY